MELSIVHRPSYIVDGVYALSMLHCEHASVLQFMDDVRFVKIFCQIYL